VLNIVSSGNIWEKCILQNSYQAMAENYDIQLLPLQYQSPPMFLFSLPLPSFLLATDNKKPQINEVLLIYWNKKLKQENLKYCQIITLYNGMQNFEIA
jgi:hypothetical protein